MWAGENDGATELRRFVASCAWFQAIDVGNGVVTPGQKDTPAEVGHLHLPADLSGRMVLDIGAYDGFSAFGAERRGAKRVLAADHWAWNWPSLARSPASKPWWTCSTSRSRRRPTTRATR